MTLDVPKYENFSKVYDLFNDEMPYNLWLDIIKYYGENVNSILDIGSGTGTVLNALKVPRKVGIDNSLTMVEIAREKDPTSEYFCDDMTQFDLSESFDMIIATADVLNYAKDVTAFGDVLQNAYKHLNKGGIFIFDVHTEYKMKTDFNYELYSDSNDDVFYTWQTIPGEAELSVWHELTFFIKVQNDLYEKFEETHYQQTYKHSDILQLADEAGFTIHHSFSDFDVNNPLTEVAERNFYILKRL